MSKTDEFIRKAKLKHGDTYDYSKVECKKSKDKVIIICKTHGEFQQIPSNHLFGSGCNKCGYCKSTEKLRSNTEEFIRKSKLKHNDTYDYSKTEYKTDYIKIIIMCKKHGEFSQTPNSHLQNGGCNKCGIERRASLRNSNTEEFINRAIQKYGDLYDYSKVKYVNALKKVIIICKRHGEFLQKPSEHLSGHKCGKCYDYRGGSQKSNKEDFITRAIQKYGDLYDYSKVEYINSLNNVIIICKQHGEFLQKPNCHLQGNSCPLCKNKTEGKLHEKLKPIYPTITTQFKQEWCKNKTYLPYDFCIPDHNIIIELDGAQHFRQVRNWSSPEEQFKNDKFKEQCANENNYSVIRLLQEDVLYDTYDWYTELCDAIEDIKRGDDIVNIYLCKNNEYADF